MVRKAGRGMFGRAKTNDEHGVNNTPLLFEHGDPVPDLLYTRNFALFSFTEAAHAAGDAKYKMAAGRLSDFYRAFRNKAENIRHLTAHGSGRSTITIGNIRPPMLMPGGAYGLP